jgi:hypothetical protein
LVVEDYELVVETWQVENCELVVFMALLLAISILIKVLGSIRMDLVHTVSRYTRRISD